MARPRKIKVSPHVVDVRTDDSILAAASASGAWLGDENRILVDSKLEASQGRECLLHEVLHALWQTSGLRARIPDQDGDSTGEDIINTLSPRLLALLRDNPAFVRYLLERE